MLSLTWFGTPIFLLLFCLLFHFFFPFSSLLCVEVKLCIRMIFTQLTNAFTGTTYTSAGSAVGTVVASLVQAKHCRNKHVLAIFSLFFLESGEYYLKMKKRVTVSYI